MTQQEITDLCRSLYLDEAAELIERQAEQCANLEAIRDTDMRLLGEAALALANMDRQIAELRAALKEVK